jgi:hypothetical protein
LLQEGVATADICYFMGEDIPVRAFLPEALRPALPAGYSFDSINADALWTLATVRDGRITLPGGASYALMVLPPDISVTLRTARKLRELVASGATLYGPPPTVSPSLEDLAGIDERQAILATLWSAPAPRIGGGKGGVVAEGDLGALLRGLGVTPGVDAASPDLMWSHRATPQRDIYFVSNQGEKPLSLPVTFRARGRQARLYDPVADRTYLLPTRTAGAGATVSLRLDVGGSAFVIFDADDQATRVTAPLNDPAGLDVAISDTDGQLVARGQKPGRWNLVIDGRRRNLHVPALPPERRITGPWRISFDNVERSVLENARALRSWSEADDPAIRFHSGTAEYRTSFAFEPGIDIHWHLALDAFRDVARITLNGHDLGIMWVPGTTLDATAALVRWHNLLVITVANSWRNRLIGDHHVPPEARRTWILENRLGRAGPQAIPADAPLLPAGLIGDVRLVPSFHRRLG